MKHNICVGGCGGVSETPGTCDSLACPKYGQPLVECDCTDGKHEHHFHALHIETESPKSEEK